MSRRLARCFGLVFPMLLLPAVALRAQSHFVRLGEAHAGNVGRVTVASLNDERLIAAVADASGNLELIVWDVTADGKFTRRGDIGAGTASVFALAAVSPSSAVTAVRRENGSLRLIDWAIDSGGNITRKGQIDAGPIDRVDIVPAGPSRVVTATVASGHTKLIVWDMSDAGEFTRRGDQNATNGSRAVVTALSATRLVLAIKDASGKLDVSSWSLNQAGSLATLQSVKGTSVSEVTLVNTALDRAITAYGLPDGTVQVQAWDVDAAGKVIAGTAAKAGATDNIALAAMGSAKVVTALRQSDHTLKLISWHVVDTVARLDTIAAGHVGGVSVAVLGWDRVVPAVQDSSKNLELIDYADFSVGMLHAQWGPTVSALKFPLKFPSAQSGASAKPDDTEPTPRSRFAPHTARRIEPGTERAEEISIAMPPRPGPGPPPPPPPQGQSPAPAFVFTPGIGGVDPMIAVGKQYVIVSEDHAIEFLYKTGPKAGQQLDSKAGESTLMSFNAFFDGFFAPKNADGTVNRNNVNLHLHFPPSFDPTLVCTPSSASPPLPCMNEAYDSRVTYDPYRGRFIALSHIRGIGFKEENSAFARRYVAIAVSRTEDPRDGFYQYLATESNFSDWPRVASNEGLLVVAHNACKSPDGMDVCDKGDQNFPTNAIALRPMAYVYRIDDMIQHQPAPRNWKVYPYETDGGKFYPVAHKGDSGGWTYLVRPNTASLDIYGFKQPLNDWTSIPTLTKASVDLENGVSGFAEGMHFQNGKLYFGGAISVAARVANTSPERWHVRGVRIPISTTANGGIKAGPCPATAGCLDFHFGLHALEDAPADVLSYEVPSLVPNADGHMILVYGRVPVQMANPIPQEARFSVYYDDARGLQRSRLIQGGDAVIKGIYCVSNPPETTPVALNFFHVNYGSATCAGQPYGKLLDYATAAADPDGKSFWVVHSYASSGKYKIVGAKVTP